MANKSIDDLSKATAYDSDNDKLGSVKEVYINDETGQPDFIEVGHGLFGMSSSLVPLRGHKLNGQDLQLAFSKDRIKDAPNLDADEHLDPRQLETLYHHYGLENTQNTENYAGGERDPQLAERGRDERTGVAGAPGALGTVDPVADPAAHTDEPRTGRAANTSEEGELTRSEEQLHVSKDREATGQVRLRKHVVHDTESVDVPVEREEVRVERTPVDPAEVDNVDRGLSDDETSVTLHEDRVNVSKDSVPVEKVKLEKDSVTDTERVSEDLAREEIETEGLGDADTSTDKRPKR